MQWTKMANKYFKIYKLNYLFCGCFYLNIIYKSLIKGVTYIIVIIRLLHLFLDQSKEKFNIFYNTLLNNKVLNILHENAMIIKQFLKTNIDIIDLNNITQYTINIPF